MKTFYIQHITTHKGDSYINYIDENTFKNDDNESSYKIVVPLDNLYKAYRITYDIDLIKEFESKNDAIEWYINDLEDGFSFIVYNGEIITSASFHCY